MRTDIEADMEHSRAAYRFAMASLPDPNDLQAGEIDARGFRFTKSSQIKSMAIELGWAFFCRYEACLEAFIKEQGLGLTKQKTLEAWMVEKEIKIPEHLKGGLQEYRRVRNWLHHRDGQNDNGTEIHLFIEHMEQFYELFVWIAAAVAAKSEKKKTI